MTRAALVCGVVLVLSVSLTAAQHDNSKESIYAELMRAPDKARAKANPLASDPDAAKAGALLFERHCAECHGENAEGKKGPSLRAPEVQDAEPGALFWLLTNGVVRKGMPVWSKLPEAQRWQLVSFIKSLKKADSADSASKPRVESIEP
jgi:mono/diheme cytochrome c family protein